MNNRALFILLILGCVELAFSQEINIYKTFGGYRFERDSISISPKMVLTIMKANPPAYEEFKRAKLNLDVTSALSFTGGILIVIPLATAIGGGDPEWALAAGGVGLFLASIPFNTAFKNHAVHALDFFNSKLSSSKRIKANFYLGPAGGKVVFRF